MIEVFIYYTICALIIGLGLYLFYRVSLLVKELDYAIVVPWIMIVTCVFLLLTLNTWYFYPEYIEEQQKHNEEVRKYEYASKIYYQNRKLEDQKEIEKLMKSLG